MTLPLPFKFDPNAAAVDPEALQADLDAIAKRFPFSRKDMKIETPHEVGGLDEPAFQNGWLNFDITAWEGARFWKDPVGLVRIQGLVKGGTPSSTSTVFVLPEGYRPGNGILAATWSAAGAGRITVSPQGNVIVENGSTTWTSLSIPSFRQEN